MPKPTKGARLGSSPAHERIILANLASQLFEHGRHRFAGRLRQRIAASVIVFQTVIDDRLGYRLAAIAAHCPRLTGNLDRQVNIVGNGQTAVITGRC